MEPLVHCRCEIDLHQYETRMQILRRYNRQDRAAQNWSDLIERLRKMADLEQEILADLAERLNLSAERLSIYRKLRLEDLELYAQVAQMLGANDDLDRAKKLLEQYKAELARQAAFDGETGLYHERLGLRLLAEKIEEAKRSGSPLAVALVGPKLEVPSPTSSLLGRRLAELIRWGDLAAHFGTQRFLLAFAASEEDQARQTLSNIRTSATAMVQGGLAAVFTYPFAGEEELALLARLEEAFERLKDKDQFFQINTESDLGF